LVMAGYHIPSGAHPDFPAIDVLAQVLGDSPAGRLHKSLVEAKKAASIGAFDLQLHDPGEALFFAEVRKENSLDVARDTLVQTIEELATKAPTAEEVDRARTSLLKNIELTLNSSGQVGLEMSEWVAIGDWRLFFIHRDRLKKVTPADVQRVAAAYLKPSNRTTALFVPTEKPDRSEIPPVPDVEAIVKDYKGDATVAEGEVFDPSPENIESRTTRVDIGGLKLALVPKKTRGKTVVATMTLRFGDEKSLMNRQTAGSLAGDMLMRGTTKHTRQQIQDEFDRLKARASVGGSPTSAFVSI
jgi:zinc protease